MSLVNPKKLELIKERKNILEYIRWCMVQYRDIKSEIVREGLLTVARVYGEKSKKLEKLISKGQ